MIVEVRSRASDEFGGAAASVDGWKQRKIVRAARLLLQERQDLARLRARFDVVIVHDPCSAEPRVEWLRHAFCAEGRGGFFWVLLRVRVPQPERAACRSGGARFNYSQPDVRCYWRSPSLATVGVAAHGVRTQGVHPTERRLRPRLLPGAPHVAAGRPLCLQHANSTSAVMQSRERSHSSSTSEVSVCVRQLRGADGRDMSRARAEPRAGSPGVAGDFLG